MKLIESNVELLKQEPGMTGINKMIELAGRTCYKSEDKITEDSAEAFVQRMINSHHTAMLEHGTVYLIIKWWQIFKFFRYLLNKYSKIHKFKYITTNLRVLQENSWLDDLKYLCEPTEFHERRITLKFITDRGVSHELVRHRVFSFAQESTRYCNYSKDKFGNEITFVKPAHSLAPMSAEDFGGEHFISALENAEEEYMYLIGHGWSPQQARAVLPNALKTEVCMTGFASDWKHFFDLRLFGKTGKPHPDMLLLAEKAKKVLEENKLWDYIMSFPSKFE